MRPEDYDDTSYGRVFCLPITRLQYLASLSCLHVSVIVESYEQLVLSPLHNRGIKVNSRRCEREWWENASLFNTNVKIAVDTHVFRSVTAAI
jgi:hypothetical protein